MINEGYGGYGVGLHENHGDMDGQAASVSKDEDSRPTHDSEATSKDSELSNTDESESASEDTDSDVSCKVEDIEDVPTVSLQHLRQADPTAVEVTASALKHHGFAWLDVGSDRSMETPHGSTGAVGLSNSSALLAELEDFLTKNERQGSPHVTGFCRSC